MQDLADLYQQLIIDHNRSPRNRRRLERPTSRAEGHNPLCGDRVTVYVDVVDGVIRDVTFEGAGCAISTASASLMTQAVKGRTVAEARALFGAFHELMTSALDRPDEKEAEAGVGKLAAFAGVRRFPVRVKCATLPWHTLEAALARRDDLVSTE